MRTEVASSPEIDPKANSKNGPKNKSKSISKNKNALTFIFITVLIDMAGFGIIMPVLPDLIRELTGEGLARASYYGGGLLLAFAAMQFLFAPIVGNLSDRFGRRPVLLISLAGFGVNYALMAFAPTMFWLFIGRLIAGALGATLATANAFIADVSPPEKRAANFGLIGAAFGVGFILGPVLGGFLAQYGVRAPFFAAAALALINVIYGLIVLPETLPPEKRRPFEWRRANPLGAFRHLAKRPIVLGLAWVMLVFGIAHQVYPAIWSFFTQEKFGWSPLDIGLSLGFVGVIYGFSQAVITRWAIPRFGEIRSATIGLIVLSLAYFAYAFAFAGWQIYVIALASFLAALIGPAINGIMSNRTSESEQGELQGAMASIAAIGAIIGPILFTGLFGTFSTKGVGIYFPGAPFFAAGVLAFFALLWFFRVAAKMRQEHKIAE